MNVDFRVDFMGEAPEGLRVGDELTIQGRVTVRAITADLVDISGIASDGIDCVLGSTTVDLFANRLQVVA